MNTPDVADVVVIGCGPVGVMTAIRCRQRGLSVIALDQSTEVFPLPRAVAMDEEIQLLFERAGLGDELRRHSSPLRGGEFVDAARQRVVGVEFPPGTVGSLGLPPTVVFDQPGLERFLRAAAVELGVDMRLGVEATAVNDSNHGAVVSVSGNEHGDISARWVVAADGAKSPTRSRRGVQLVDQGFDQTWLVVDTTLLDPSLPLPSIVQQVCDPERICTFVPGTGAHRRWEFRLHDHETRDEMLDDDVIARLLSPWGSREQLRIDRSAVYRFHAVVAETFRDGPLFLAGDAAHQMPPFNGQGMCTGMRDAENLSWKLAHVAHGLADDGLLDTYDAERRPHAAGQVAHAADAGRLIDAVANDGEAALESGYGQRSFPKLTGEMLVGEHRLVGGVVPVPLVASAPPSEDWTLFHAEGHEPDSATVDAWRRLGATIVAAPAAAYPTVFDDGAVMIVRPDRIVGAVTSDPVALARLVTPGAQHRSTDHVTPPTEPNQKVDQP